VEEGLLLRNEYLVTENENPNSISLFDLMTIKEKGWLKSKKE
jgi:hypothetical protein